MSGDLLPWIAEPLAYDFMVRALVAAIATSVVCAVLSCWLVLIGWSLMGDAVSHAVLPGVALAYVVGAPFSLGALASGGLAVGLIGLIRGTSRVKEDAAIGIVFTAFFAVGLVLISVVPSQTDLHHIVFGNLLGVGWADAGQIVLIATTVLAALLVKRRDITLYAFDSTYAHAIGLDPKRIGAGLLVALALTTVIALQVVGVVLVVAMLITPGATASLLTDRLSRMLVLAPAIAVTSAVGGVYSSFYLDTATGPSIVVLQGVLFAAAFIRGWRPGGMGRGRLVRRHA